MRLLPTRWAAARRKWNQPVAWPVVLALGLIAIAAIPAVRSYRRRERMAARPA
jgi:MYXO-CTERM domain-containing protein